MNFITESMIIINIIIVISLYSNLLFIIQEHAMYIKFYIKNVGLNLS